MAVSRREFSAQMIGSLMAYGLIEGLWARDLFADPIKPTIGDWFKELLAMTKDLKGRKLTDLEFQTKMEDLYRRVDLPGLLSFVKLESVGKSTEFPANGAAGLPVDTRTIEGLPADVGFGKQLFGCNKGRSIVPHGHANMCTGFIVLKGTWVGKHYDRVETLKDHYIIKPTIDKEFQPGDLSTISDHKDNIHWFKATTDGAFLFNVHVTGYDTSIKETTGRLYLDVDGEKLAGGLVKAAKMTSGACHKKFG